VGGGGSAQLCCMRCMRPTPTAGTLPAHAPAALDAPHCRSCTACELGLLPGIAGLACWAWAGRRLRPRPASRPMRGQRGAACCPPRRRAAAAGWLAQPAPPPPPPAHTPLLLPATVGGGRAPVLVEAALDLVAQVLRPHGVEGAQAARGLHVAHDAHHHHGGALDDGHRLARLLLVQLGAGLLHLAHNVGHAGLVAHEGRQVGLLRGIIAGEALHLAAAAPAALPGREAQVTAPGVCRRAGGRSRVRRGAGWGAGRGGGGLGKLGAVGLRLVVRAALTGGPAGGACPPLRLLVAAPAARASGRAPRAPGCCCRVHQQLKLQAGARGGCQGPHQSGPGEGGVPLTLKLAVRHCATGCAERGRACVRPRQESREAEPAARQLHARPPRPPLAPWCTRQLSAHQCPLCCARAASTWPRPPHPLSRSISSDDHNSISRADSSTALPPIAGRAGTRHTLRRAILADGSRGRRWVGAGSRGGIFCSCRGSGGSWSGHLAPGARTFPSTSAAPRALRQAGD